MGSSFLIPLLLSAASKHLHSIKDNVTESDSLEKRKSEASQIWRNKIADWKRINDEEIRKWVEDGPIGGGESDEKWDNVLDEWKQKPREEHKEWEETAWKLLRNWTEDDSMSSINFWSGGIGQHGFGHPSSPPMIHVTSRFTVNNETEERVALIPASSFQPLMSHLSSSPMFAQYAPMLLLGVLPIFLILFLMPFIMVPFLIALIVLPMIVMMFGSLSVVGTALMPMLPFGMEAMEHLITWLSDQDVDSVFEKSGVEDLVESLATNFTTTLSPALVENSVVVTEVPRMLWW